MYMCIRYCVYLHECFLTAGGDNRIVAIALGVAFPVLAIFILLIVIAIIIIVRVRAWLKKRDGKFTTLCIHVAYIEMYVIYVMHWKSFNCVCVVDKFFFSFSMRVMYGVRGVCGALGEV